MIDNGKTVLNGTLQSIKQKFGSNSLQLEFEGDGSFLGGLPMVERLHDYGQYVELQLTQGGDAQEVLRASHDRLRIRRFEIVAPTLHNIFIQQVGQESADA